MSTGIPGMLLAWDASWNIVASLDMLVWSDANGRRVLVNFEAHEQAGGRMRDCWYVPEAIGSGSWPEWLPTDRLHEFRVRVDHSHPLRIRELIHKESAHARARADLVAEIARRREQAIRDLSTEVHLPDDVRIDFATELPIDLRDLVGGPNRPLTLDAEGRTAKPQPMRDWLGVSRIEPLRASDRSDLENGGLYIGEIMNAGDGTEAVAGEQEERDVPEVGVHST